MQGTIATDRGTHSGAPTGLVGDVQVHVCHLAAGGPNVRLDLPPLSIQDIAEHHFRPFAGKQLRFCSPLTSCSATNQGHFPIQSSHLRFLFVIDPGVPRSDGDSTERLLSGRGCNPVDKSPEERSKLLACFHIGDMTNTRTGHRTHVTLLVDARSSIPTPWKC